MYSPIARGRKYEIDLMVASLVQNKIKKRSCKKFSKFILKITWASKRKK